MKYWLMLSCLFLFGCGSSGPANIVEDADATALQEYEAALAEADAEMEGYVEPE